MFGVPESLLSDRGTNPLANVMMDVCSLLGITKLNTTAYHPQCNGMVERMNRTLKAMLRKLTWCFVGLSQRPTRDYKREAIVSDVWLRSSITH